MKRVVKIYSFYFVILSLIIRCSKSPTESPFTISSGKYNYYAYNKNNDFVASGYFTISITDSLITGNKSIQDIGSEHQLESGEGEISGRIIGTNRIEIYLYETGGPYLLIEGNFNDGIIDGKRITGSATGIWTDTLGIFRSDFLE